MIKKISLILIILLLNANQANAGFDVTRMTTVVDDFSGSFTSSKNGRFDDNAFVGTSLTEFTNFHIADNPDAPGITGVISKNISRSSGVLETIADGSLTVVGHEHTLEISFTELSALYDEALTITGEVSVNDEVFDAQSLPPFVAGV